MSNPQECAVSFTRLAAILPNLFGANAGSNNLAGKNNADIAALFESDFVVQGTKLDAQVLATALSVYATSGEIRLRCQRRRRRNGHSERQLQRGRLRRGQQHDPDGDGPA